ncbi:MAG: hypothetical protein AVDCRST_MAG44-993, partial [uncultured Sphingomonas sp.]
EPKHHPPRIARRRGAGGAARRLHIREDPGKADRDQPQRHDPAGSVGPPATRRRAADQSEPAGVSAAAATRAASAAAM